MYLKYVIREFELKDINKLNVLLSKLMMFESKYSSNLVKEIEVKGNFKEILNNEKNVIFVVTINSDIIGFVSVYEKTLDEVFVNKEAFIESIYVEEEYRHLGIGKMLIHEVIKWANNRGIKYLDIEVMKGNDNAINAYLKWGFETSKIGLRKEI